MGMGCLIALSLNASWWRIGEHTTHTLKYCDPDLGQCQKQPHRCLGKNLGFNTLVCLRETSVLRSI